MTRPIVTAQMIWDVWNMTAAMRHEGVLAVQDDGELVATTDFAAQSNGWKIITTQDDLIDTADGKMDDAMAAFIADSLNSSDS